MPNEGNASWQGRATDCTAEMGILSVTRGPFHLPTDVRDRCGSGQSQDQGAEEYNWLTWEPYPWLDFETASPLGHSSYWEGVGGHADRDEL